MIENIAIPGQSLTDEPKNFAWERPPEIADPNEAVKHHLKYLNTEDAIESTLFVLESGLPISTLVSTLMTNAVGNGIHSIDVGLIISPVIHESIKSTAEEAGVNYKEKFSDEKQKSEARKQRKDALIRSALESALEDDDPTMDQELIEETVEAMGSPETEAFEAAAQQQETAQSEPEAELPMEEEQQQTQDMPSPSQTGKGLMSRGGM